MSTANTTIQTKRITEVLKELKAQKVKHYPVRRQDGHYEVTFFPNAKVDFLLLKYDLRFGQNNTIIRP